MNAPFTIDTGTVQTGALQYVPDWAQDWCPDNATDAEKVRSYAMHIIGALRDPVKMETVRKHTLGGWAFLRALADEQPDLFDLFWTEYAEAAFIRALRSK